MKQGENKYEIRCQGQETAFLAGTHARCWPQGIEGLMLHTH